MQKFSALIVADTGIAELPIGSLGEVVRTHHVFGVSPSPTLDLATEAGTFTVRRDQVRILSGAEAHAERARRKRARREERKARS